ncbi:MAG: hypothetical protein EB110_06270, partial [Betaproteobacteria bacterium]|nr:hypothetical protein [Betaproteobacteria bacterium]
LRGGESIFYFRVAPRYLIFIGHLLLGENDTLIALVWVSLGFAAALYLGARFADRYSGLQNCLVGIFVSFICLIFIGDQTIVAFGFFVSSEYPTWLTLFALSAYLLSPKPEHRTWPIALMAGLLASMVQFRPNSVFVALALLPLLLSRKVQRENSKLAALQISSAITTFLIIVALSLIHNLFYGANFVIFTPAPSSDNYYFRVEDLLSSDGVGAALARIWTQLASLMYWRLPNDPSQHPLPGRQP